MTEAARRYGFGALAHRNFRLFLFGQTISLTGTWMQSVAQGWLVLELTNSPFYLGLVSALGSLGVLLFTLYAGVIADRTDKRRTVLITQTLQMLQAFALAALVWSGHVTTESVMILAAFLGVVAAFDIPTRQAFIVEMVGKEDLMNAIALNTSVFNLTRVLGPVIAGLLIGAKGVAICFFLNGVSYLAVIGSLLAMRLPPHIPQLTQLSAWQGFREVLAFLRDDRRVSTLVVLTAIISIFGFPFLLLMPVFARDVLRVGARGYGVLSAAVGLGAVGGALGVAVLGQRIRKGRTLVAAGITFGLLLMVFASSRVFPLSLALLALVGAAMIVNNALTNTLLQTLVPDHLRGRVMGFYSFMFVGMAPLGAFQAGVFAERLGAPAAVAMGGVISALAVAMAGWRVPELRRAL
ncbi:MAG: MFS transporter [Gemmatimonadales bacterium]